MKITYKPSLNSLIDYYQYILWYSKEKSTYRFRSRFIGIMAGIAFILIMMSMTGPHTNSSIIGIFALGAFFSTIGFIMAKTLVINRANNIAEQLLQDEDNAKLYGESTLEFNESEIMVTSGIGDGKMDRSLIIGIQETTHSIFIIFSKYAALTISKDALNNEQLEFIRDLEKTTTNKP